MSDHGGVPDAMEAMLEPWTLGVVILLGWLDEVLLLVREDMMEKKWRTALLLLLFEGESL